MAVESTTPDLKQLGDDLQRSRLERLFHSLDLNKDGKVDPDELEKGLEKMGYAHVSEEMIKVCSKFHVEVIASLTSDS